MAIPDRKARRLMSEYNKTGVLRKAALRSDMDEKTARKYVKAGKLPSQMRVAHTWRTREDPFAAHWPVIEAMLADAPELEGKRLFEWLCDEHPGLYEEGQLRTFQRKLGRWRAESGPEREVYFGQEHHPGVRMSTDWTHMGEEEITIGGERFDHLLCHCVLTYSNWEWATICYSESMLSLRNGLQAALFELGHVSDEHWTDHSSAATHRPCKEAPAADRQFNQEYVGLMKHFGLRPRTIQPDSPHENGDVESLNGALKRRIRQHLLLRGSKDFESIEAYRLFIEHVVRRANAGRCRRVAAELQEMRQLSASKLAEYREYTCRVRKGSTITVDRRAYSVPSRLIGEQVDVRRYETHLEVYFKDRQELDVPWISREAGHRINYRHIIHSLVRKPGAFRNYRYHSDLFPDPAFRQAYDVLCECGEVDQRTADREYLQILEHAAKTMECEVIDALKELQAKRRIPRLSRVLGACPDSRAETPAMKPLDVRLAEYDALLSGKEKVA